MALNSERGPRNAAANLWKHRTGFPEASTAFADSLSITIPDPDHSGDEERLRLLSQTEAGRLAAVAHTERGAILVSSPPVSPPLQNAARMRKASPESRKRSRPAPARADSGLRAQYELSGGQRGKYADRNRAGTNVVVLNPDVAARFPDVATVNQALRAAAELVDETPPKPRSKHRTT